MRLFDSDMHWQGLGTITVVALLTLLTLAFAVVSYAEWSSDDDVTRFASVTSLASHPHRPGDLAAQSRTGRTGCPQGARSLPTELMPLP
ncbi:MAG: hypothetical protein ABW175_19115 [Bradyrhizobium sp.]